jgi:hypothetical protein
MQQPVIDIENTKCKEHKVFQIGVYKTFELADSPATLTIKLPNRLYTFYSWDNILDCLGCGDIEYRFSNKRYQYLDKVVFFGVKTDPIQPINLL